MCEYQESTGAGASACVARVIATPTEAHSLSSHSSSTRALQVARPGSRPLLLGFFVCFACCASSLHGDTLEWDAREYGEVRNAQTELRSRDSEKTKNGDKLDWDAREYGEVRNAENEDPIKTNAVMRSERAC